jgi:hypothetical protein
MSTTEPQPTGRGYVDYETDTGTGWVLFAGAMLGILATMNFIYGLAAVSKSTFLVGDAKFVASGVKTWGWVLILISVAQLAAAFGVMARWPGVRWAGVVIAALNAIAQLVIMPAYPLWAVSLFVLDILVIYALVVHGGRRAG